MAFAKMSSIDTSLLALVLLSSSTVHRSELGRLRSV